MEGIITYIARDSTYYSLITAERIIEAIERISDFPMSGRVIPEYENENIREVIYKNYRFIYKLEGKEIFIITIIHGKRKL